MSAPGPFRDKSSLRVESLALSRGQRVLFEGLSFAAASGSYVEVRGANGSGKTSLLRAIAGFLRPSAGRIHFENTDGPAEALHYVGHLNALKANLSVRAHLRYWAGLFGGPVDEGVLDRVGLGAQAVFPARALSQGQARRLALARLLAAPRAVWLLDEPAAALDDQGRAFVGELISAHCASGGSVLAAVHEPLGPPPAHAVILRA